MVLALASALNQNDPGISERRAVYTIELAGNAQHRVVCVTGMSLLGSGDSCGNARGRLSRKRRYEPFVTQMSHLHLYLAIAVSVLQNLACTHVFDEAHTYFMNELSPHTVYEVHT